MYKKNVKRILDVIGSAILLTLLFPLFFIIGVLIKIDSDGRVFFEQERLGQNGKIFKIIKFRTMVEHAEECGDGIFIKSDSDPRVTRMGKVLRGCSLDELPNLINVLKGDMSLVGPRPPVVYHPYNGYHAYPKRAKMRFRVKPGVVGLAGIRVHNNASWEERIKIDVEYVKRCSFLLDVYILMKTVTVMFHREVCTLE